MKCKVRVNVESVKVDKKWEIQERADGCDTCISAKKKSNQTIACSELGASKAARDQVQHHRNTSSYLSSGTKKLGCQYKTRAGGYVGKDLSSLDLGSRYGTRIRVRDTVPRASELLVTRVIYRLATSTRDVVSQNTA